MLRFVKSAILTLALALSGWSSFAFSMLGPLDTWQVQRISYGHVAPVFDDIGGPMNLGEEYRLNIKTITYSFDADFLNYFGQRGADEVRKAFAILNALPPFSKMSEDLSEFPLNTRRENYEAAGLFLFDIKSEMLSVILSQIGLASPERYVWTLRDRVVFPGPLVQYTVIMRNFDPITSEPSKFVNGTLYTYGIFEIPQPPYDWADAVEFPLDPLAPTFTAVVSANDGLWGGILSLGQYVTGLTRDDVAGLRHLYRKENVNVEGLLPDTLPSSGNPGSPFDPSNTNGPVNIALRPGVDKLTFVEVKNNSVLGPFAGITNRYSDTYITNGVAVKQFTQRILTNAPDILFTVQDLNGGAYVRTDTGTWINNDAINGSAGNLAGPGVISSGAIITLSKTGPFFINDDSNPLFMFEPGATPGFVWGAYDGTTNRPIVFPSWESIEELERKVLGR
jgi:hypothetical protein